MIILMVCLKLSSLQLRRVETFVLTGKLSTYQFFHYVLEIKLWMHLPCSTPLLPSSPSFIISNIRFLGPSIGSHIQYRVFIKYCFFRFFKNIPASGLSLFSLGVSVCTHTRQVPHQRCTRTSRVQKNHNILRKKHNI